MAWCMKAKKGCPVKRFIAMKCHSAKNKKACHKAVFMKMMKVPCFRAIATTCKKNKKCWMRSRGKLMKCMAVTKKRMFMKMMKNPCFASVAKKCKKDKKCWKNHKAQLRACFKKTKKEEEDLEELEQMLYKQPCFKAALKKCNRDKKCFWTSFKSCKGAKKEEELFVL